MPNATTFIIEQVLNGWNGSVAGDLIETVVVTQTKHGPFKSDGGCVMFELHYYYTPDGDGE